MIVPDYLIELSRESDKKRAWVASLPATIHQISKEWNLTLGEPYVENATCAYVVRCWYAGKEEAVLKIGMPHFEAQHEIEGLRLLNGNPTIRLLKSHNYSNSMLLEKCTPGSSLNLLDLPNQDEIICGLLREIWKTKDIHSKFRPLSTMILRWNEDTHQNLDSFPNPSLAKLGCKLKEELTNSNVDSVLLATDLHAGNVLKAHRKPWLAIDIKPFTGDPAYDLTQHLINTIERLHENPNREVKKIADLANINADRLMNWLFARLASEFGGVHQKIAMSLKMKY